ncbi:MAG: PAS domain-containing protein [Deltaproteobacteria bacterium]|nr:PAS domain-containing protein [Deltaproteobacteria bacterium]
MRKKRTNTFWLGTPPWIIIGSVIVLVPIFVFWTLDNLQRQKEATTLLLLEKGAALIRSFEAGARTGMMGMMSLRGGGGFQLQRLLMETARQPDIVYIMVTDADGVIHAHSDPEKIGMDYGRDLGPGGLSRLRDLHWRRLANPASSDIFEVYRAFAPARISYQRSHQHMKPDPRSPQIMMRDDESMTDQIIFVGLDMGPVEAAQKEETRHILIMASILLLIGFGGISTVFLFQAYRSAKSSLTRIKAFSDSVVENMPIGLAALDRDGSIISFNQVAESILLIPVHQALGQKARELLPASFQSLLDEETSSKSAIEKELDCILRNGKAIPMDVSISPLEGEDGQPLGRIILFRDLTEVQALKKEIELSHRLASIGRLAAGVAHEIRNPLSSIKGFATYFKDRYQDIPEDKKTAEIMIQEVERLNRVIGQLLEFARPVTIQKKPTSIHALIQHSIKMIERDAREKKITIDKTIPLDLPDIYLDMDRMNQVLLNLYLNAIDAMENGGRLTVQVKPDHDSQRLRIMVQDTGQGIDKKDLVHVFDPYFTTKQSGTGLGLAIVRKIIESHNGEIRVESEEGQGTSVTIFLPYS